MFARSAYATLVLTCALHIGCADCSRSDAEDASDPGPADVVIDADAAGPDTGPPDGAGDIVLPASETLLTADLHVWGSATADAEMTVIHVTASGGVAVTVDIVAGATGNQVAHDIAEALQDAGVEAASVGDVVSVTTGEIGLAAVPPGVTMTPLEPEPPLGYPAEEVYCDPLKSSKDEPPLPPSSEPDGWGGSLGPGHDPNSEPPPWPCQEPYRGQLQLGCVVLPHSGEFLYQKRVLHIASRGMPTDLVLTYRSRKRMRIAPMRRRES